MWCERVSSLRESLLNNTDKSHRYNADRSITKRIRMAVIGSVAVLPKSKGQDFYLRSFRRGMIQKSMFDHESTASVCVVGIRKQRYERQPLIICEKH